MKTAISIHETLLENVDRTARKMGVSRSRLFSLAVQDYLNRRHNEEILEQLNQVYGKHPASSDGQTTRGIKAKFRSTIKDRW